MMIIMPFFSIREFIIKIKAIKIANKSDKKGPVTNAKGNKQSNNCCKFFDFLSIKFINS